jgi:hypothetical protein
MPKIKRKIKKNRLAKNRGFVTLLLVLLAIAMGVLLSGSFLKNGEFQFNANSNITPTPAGGALGDAIPVSPGSSKNNLELQTLKFSTPAPSQTCQVEGKVVDGCSCPNQQYKSLFGGPTVMTSMPEEVCGGSLECEFQKICEACNWGASDPNGACDVPSSLIGNAVNPSLQNQVPTNIICGGPIGLKSRLSINNTPFCFGKPVIYLYPEKPTLVNVKLTIPGEVYISIPTYPTDGWKNVLAQPSGMLTYQGKTYNELYYESKVTADNITPASGVIIPISELKSKLFELTGKLGLKNAEQLEFLDYWLPKLKSLNKPYILFSVLSESQKESVDHVNIEPKPDVFINFLAYFKGLDKPIEIQPLNFPPIPTRSGFTAVEWGGTIDNN